jgi:hypothetical protein
MLEFLNIVRVRTSQDYIPLLWVSENMRVCKSCKESEQYLSPRCPLYMERNNSYNLK